MPTIQRTLILSSGDVAGLLATATTEQTLGLGEVAIGDVAVLFPGLWPDLQADRRSAALKEIANCYGLSIAERSLSISGMHGFNEGELESLVLMDALAYARRAGFDEVLWAIHSPGTRETPKDAPPDVDRASMTITRSMLLERLMGLDAGAHPVRVRAPYADLTDRQLADLAVDMDLPVWTCWWWGATNEQPEAHRQLAHWTALLRDAGWVGRPSSEPTPTT